MVWVVLKGYHKVGSVLKQPSKVNARQPNEFRFCHRVRFLILDVCAQMIKLVNIVNTFQNILLAERGEVKLASKLIKILAYLRATLIFVLEAIDFGCSYDFEVFVILYMF